MSEEAPLQISLSDFKNAIARYSNQIEAGQEFSKDEYMTIGRLWNTVLYYTVLQSNPEGHDFLNSFAIRHYRRSWPR